MDRSSSGDHARAESHFDELENAAFVEGFTNERCVDRCRDAVVEGRRNSLAIINALDECALDADYRIRLFMVGIANRTLDVPTAAKRLAGHFPGHELGENHRAVVELAYQLEHDHHDKLSSSFDELISLAEEQFCERGFGTKPDFEE